MEMNLKQQQAYELGKEYEGTDVNYFWYNATEQECDLANDCNEFFEAGRYGFAPRYVTAVRYGEIPASGYSKNHATGETEKGVSVIKIVESAEETVESIYDITLGQQGFEKIVVSGWYCGDRGADGEALLVNAVKIG